MIFYELVQGITKDHSISQDKHDKGSVWDHPFRILVRRPGITRDHFGLLNPMFGPSIGNHYGIFSYVYSWGSPGIISDYRTFGLVNPMFGPSIGDHCGIISSVFSWGSRGIISDYRTFGLVNPIFGPSIGDHCGIISILGLPLGITRDHFGLSNLRTSEPSDY